MFELQTIPEYRENYEKEMSNKAISLAQNYATAYISAQLGLDFNLAKIMDNPEKIKKKYILQCESMVWPILFPSPLVPSYFDRNEFYKAFENWDGNVYVLIFCKELKKLLL